MVTALIRDYVGGGLRGLQGTLQGKFEGVSPLQPAGGNLNGKSEGG